jgi:phosphoribosylformylglycinamidine cyclo-ligase
VNGLDLAGAVLGVQRRDRVISGEACRPGDRVVGLPSSGVHSNGLSLARRIAEANGGYGQPFGPETLGRELLTPTRIYSEVLGIVERHEVHGMCHITGGGLLNLSRLTRHGFTIDDPIPPLPVFAWLQERGGVSTAEMYRTFNMGMGFALVVPPDEADAVASEVLGARVVGSCTAEPGIRLGDLAIE